MSKVKLSAKWQLDAALLSRPVDLTALVTMSKSTPDKFTEDDTLHRLVKLLLNEKNKVKSDKDTKLDVLTILANVAGAGSAGNALARVALSNVSEWFDEYISTEESDPSQEPEVSLLLSHERKGHPLTLFLSPPLSCSSTRPWSCSSRGAGNTSSRLKTCWSCAKATDASPCVPSWAF
jgi:hypothetical protein